MDRSSEPPETRDDTVAVPELSVSGLPAGFTGLPGASDQAEREVSPDYGTLKDNRMNRWTVRDDQVPDDDQAVGVEPA
ncbi:hypothetical protein [Brevundimonas subvibrioides]|uniref:Outer membrane lipoprotein LolB n=1 Tax=Brevundimonas subvibrioides (strain ATCC 15264 / DSM 4735 / LMG 14903 / NBRC 16000 / CB 81) TaxID=633149 RepID=D9QN80_BRESC|nr:hypothetical protein [Brevundimonas subvibrioides]ADL00281.1 outer membrane lipoprotein LolB [Brevundimonas subvibrioides ATCC 15264]